MNIIDFVESIFPNITESQKKVIKGLLNRECGDAYLDGYDKGNEEGWYEGYHQGRNSLEEELFG